ncbi:hypothetical protein FALBO_11130 [Fusarium albosuccineum]|uniref:Heterokaryon incompatibility domain-containing protein n=1 Tax=Fusarium albosuccineum TaxID=1237068 RepID=A0A8H4P973_9HYPO|nr:hypothetical protein FALBO_11130 [Fusarium albosuccineum]
MDRSPSAIILPRRLLDVGNTWSKRWHIVHTEGRSRKYSKYVALSHRWSAHTPKLSRRNLEKFKSPRASSRLPKDYQDIILVCRALSIRYLWIDSLCILQDSDADFNHEAATMMDIYINAFLTFSICWGCSDVGLFSNRNRGPFPPSVMPKKRIIPQSLTPWRAGTPLPPMNHIEDWDTSVSNALVNSRGWVLQERILSQRIFYFGNDQLYWECHGCKADETHSDKLSVSGGRQSVNTGLTRLVQHSWPETVETYMNCELSDEKDRLTAISGLARHFGEKLRIQYRAGIWIGVFIRDLLWDPAAAHDTDVSSRRRPVINQETHPSIPSWSWAALPEPVKMHRTDQCLIDLGPEADTKSGNIMTKPHTLVPLAVMTKSTITSPESDPFEHFEHASLEMRCFPIPLDFDVVKDLDRFRDASNSNGIVQLSLNIMDTNRGEVSLDKLRLVALEPHNTNERVDVCFSRPWDSSQPCFFVPLYMAACSLGKGNHSLRRLEIRKRPVRGLVLQERPSNQASSQQSNELRVREFVRIGTLMEAPNVGCVLTPAIVNTVVKRGCRIRDETEEQQSVKRFEAGLQLIGRWLYTGKFEVKWGTVVCSALPSLEVNWTNIRLV